MSKEKLIIDLCSSDEEEEDVFGDENTYDETEEEGDEDTNSSEDDSDWSHDDDDATDSDVEADETGEKGDNDDGGDDDKVTRLLTAGSDLKSVNVKECKAYLRKHGLRLSGTKPVCIERILEHWRIKDGSGEAVYPRSSFAINCKGDVCKGDVVLFTQKVHHKYEKMKRSGNIMGRRTVAGQVVKESYGTAKQQHTFTIQVLWCEGTQKLPPLYPLLVKGRNLYRLMTLRQRWPNEKDRVKILNEKHNRGAAARKVMRERKIKSGYVLKDGRLQKPGHVKKPCQGQASFNPHANTHAVPVTHQRRPYQNHHVGSNSGYNLGVRDLDHFSHMMISHRTEGDTYRQSEVSQGPYMNHQTYHSNFSSGYNHGARDLYMVNHGREGDNHRPNYR
ncbi:unnamed protein product [Arabidopsis arenosa]|uniref:SAP domain-containing protein n=1 Tax=Arabidopsis arenosa TaxID=38785 RepID=A0A8S2BAR1_ARAAE|nr:unnamed protein product [Arabidopsis arenosa]